MNIDITGALLKLSLSMAILNSQYKEGASDVNVQWRTLINSNKTLHVYFRTLNLSDTA